MEYAFHDFTNLFAQLGLPNDPEGIQMFLRAHSPIPAGVRLEEASFWTPAQATFLKEDVAHDGDWAIVADRLSAVLRQTHK